jgi:hypothetical protein
MKKTTHFNWMVKAGIFMMFILFSLSASAQESSLEGKKIWLLVESKEEGSDKVKADLETRLEEWGYWELVSAKEDADLLLELNLDTYSGATAWSWGGLTVKASVELKDTSGEKIWGSKEYKASPNGTNGFNASRKTTGKIVGEMKKKFK